MRRTTLNRNILFLDEDNACLSQIAEAVAKHLNPPKVRIYSAGLAPSTIPAPVQNVMQELGIKMEGQRAKGIEQIPLHDIDLVVSFVDVDKRCPDLAKRTKIERWALSAAGAQGKGENIRLNDLRERRDEIDKRVWALFRDHWRNVV